MVMNICIIGQYPPKLGGVATYMKNLEDELQAMGHNVYVLTYKQDCDFKDNVFCANTVNIPVLRGVSFIISAYFKLREIIKKYDIDVIHANYLIPPGIIASLIHKKDIKIVMTAHGSDINILPENKIIRPILKHTLKCVDEVYFVSEKLQQKALAMNIEGLAEKSKVTPNTVNINKFKPIDENTKTLNEKYQMPVVVFIGNLVKQKGLKYLLKAKKLSKTTYTLLIYGDGILKDELKNYIKENKIQNTHLMGKTDTPEIIIPQSDIMVLPSVSEGASLVALEAMSCAKPLIATDTGNITTTIKNNHDGIIVPTCNPQKLADAIDELIEDEDKRIKIGENARKTVIENYSKMQIPYANKEQ